MTTEAPRPIVDHVTIAGTDLDRLCRTLADAGLKPEYGGSHSNGVTHMSLLGFDDGSYVELISTVERGVSSPWWSQHVAADGGPCGWAIRTETISEDVDRLIALDIPVSGPEYYHRERPDGTLVEWDLAFPGEGEPGVVLPFLIEDRTPRERRVQPTPVLARSGLTGVETVTVCVDEFEHTVDRFRHVFEIPEPVVCDDEQFEARVADVPGTPIAVASPDEGSWLGERLERFGPSPCSYLLGTSDFSATAEHLAIRAEESWFGRRVRWLDVDGLDERALGVVERDPSPGARSDGGSR